VATTFVDITVFKHRLKLPSGEGLRSFILLDGFKKIVRNVKYAVGSVTLPRNLCTSVISPMLHTHNSCI
jgi:hypothetical protein